MSSPPLDLLIAQTTNLSKQGLRPFVEKQLKQVHGQNWLAKTECRIVAGQPHWDLQALLKTVIVNWQTAFQSVLPPSARSLAFELKDWRNHVAHEHEMTLDDVIRLMDTSVRLLKAIGGARNHSSSAVLGNYRLLRSWYEPESLN